MNKSESITELAKALNTFQGKMRGVKKDAVNPFFKSRYATLDSIWEAIREPLAGVGLSVVQTLDYGDKPLLDTTLLHISGEWIGGSMLLNPIKDDPQGLGSAISYARRYSLSAILGIVADEEDDANSATKPPAKPEPKAKTRPTNKPTEPVTLGSALGILEEKLPKKWGHTVIAARMMDKYGVSGDTMAALIEALNPEQKEELTNIVSTELAKIGGK